MNLDDIQAFLAVYNTGSISKAALALYMNQSNLSTKIQHLENELGVELFNRGRGRHSIELTVQGQKFLQIAEQINHSMKEIDYIKSSTKKEFVSIAANEVTNLFTLVPFYTDFMLKHPNITLNIHTYHSTEIYNKLEQNSFDIGIVSIPRAFSGIKTIPIYNESMYLVSPQDSPYYNGIHAKDLPAEKELCIRWNPVFNAWHDGFFGDHNYSIRISNGSELPSYMIEKDMWSIVSLSTALKLVKTNPISINSIYEEPPKISFYMVEKEKKYRSEALDTFIDALFQYIRTSIDIESTIG